jgi:hypothetical protein
MGFARDVTCVAVAGLVLHPAPPALASESSTAAFPAEAREAPAPAEPVPDRPRAAPPRGGEIPEAESAGQRGTLFVARPGVTFYRLGSDDEPVRFCIAPCRALLSGEQRFALGFEGRAPIVAGGSLTVSPEGVVEGEYTSASETRRMGWLILGLGIPGSLITIATGAGIALESQSAREDALGAAMLAGGGLGLAASLVMGLVMSLAGDSAAVHVRPNVP